VRFARSSRPAIQFVAGVLCALLVGPTAVASTTQAPTVGSPSVPDAVGTTVDLGQYALNGAVRSALRDPATGTTLVGGEFTRIGLRTGGVATVGLPGASDGSLSAGSPEVVGNVQAVFADDRPGDPGFFVVGKITAINGVAVAKSQPVHRIHLVSGVWVRDGGWAVDGSCNVGNIQFPMDMPWIATDSYLIGGHLAGADSWMGSITGVVLISRSSGVMRTLGKSGCSVPALLSDIPNLPSLNGCSGKTHCEAYVGRLAWEPTTRRLLVSYTYVEGSEASYVWGESVAAYDLTSSTGGRMWHRWLQDGPPGAGPHGTTQSAATLPGAFLLAGTFPLAGDATESAFGRRLLLDAATGQIDGRWNAGGEQDPATGAPIGPATSCLTDTADSNSIPARVGSTAYAWVDHGSLLCGYELGADGVDTTEAAARTATVNEHDVLPPAIPYTAGDGTTYLLGSREAVDLATGGLAAWNPDPAMNAQASMPSVAVSGTSAIVAGDFRFVRGVPMAGVAALDASLAPVSGFVSPFTAMADGFAVHSMAMRDGRLVVGGSTGGAGQSVLAALDPATGSITWQAPSPQLITIDVVAFDAAGDLWAGGTSNNFTAPDRPLLHFAALDAGGGSLAAPSFGCLDLSARSSAFPDCEPEWGGRTSVNALIPEADGGLTVAGVFGSVDGSRRRGLARLDADGVLTAWDPDLPGAFGITPQTVVKDFAPMSLAVLADQLVLGGRFNWEREVTAGDILWAQLPLVVISRSTGAVLRPTGPEFAAWIDPKGWWLEGHDLLPTDGGLVVAFGEAGMGVVDATTFDLDEVSSAPYLDPDWLTPVVGNGIYALAHPVDTASGPGFTAVPATAGSGITPAGTSSKLVFAGTINRWKNRVAGNVVGTTVAPDTTPPVVSAVRVAPRTGSVVSGGATRVRVQWTAADPHGSGAASYDISWKVGAGTWQTIASHLLSRGFDVTVKPGRDYRFRVRARDNAGNLGAWSAGPMIHTSLVQQASSHVRWSSGWHTVRSDAFSGGSARKRSVHGATATFTFTGRGVGFVTTLAPRRGRVKVYVDGRYVKTLDLRSATARYRTVAWSRAWTTSGRHVVKLVVRGTSGRPRIDVDAFVVVH
jgi:Domain of unknown function (DUF5122) beta-propeller/Fibronectin type III domain